MSVAVSQLNYPLIIHRIGNCTFATAKVLHFFEICKFFFVFLKNLSFARTQAHTFKVRTAFAVQRYNNYLEYD